MSILENYLLDLFKTNLNWPEQLAQLITTTILIILWVLIGVIVTLILKLIIKRILKRQKREMVKREKTVVALILSVIKVFFWFFIIVMILNQLGVNIVPILASAGILMFALGFGAQAVITDFISGVFLIFEHAFDVGDVVQIGDFKGVVLEIGLRRTKIKNPANEVRVLNNGDIRAFTNFSLDISVGIVDVVIPKSFSYDNFFTPEFSELLSKFSDYENILTTPEIIGMMSDDATTYTFRVSFKADPNTHKAIERLLRKDILEYVRAQRLAKLI